MQVQRSKLADFLLVLVCRLLSDASRRVGGDFDFTYRKTAIHVARYDPWIDR
jgi:hypothetical protein